MAGKRLNQKMKLDRRYGLNVHGRAKSPVNKRKYAPGQHGPTKRTGSGSEYGRQLKAKQILKGYYGNIGEKKFRRYYQEAEAKRGDASQNMIGMLELRLDTVIYRAKFAPTVFAARQIVNHGHVLVNDKRVKIASYQVKPGDVITLSKKAQEMALIISSVESNERSFCDYVNVDAEKLTATYVRVPAFEDVPYPISIEPSLIVEFYSR